MAEREYQRLTRNRSRIAFGVVSTGRSSLWLGKDHVLCIDINGYTETYKRFYFRDIQAVLVRKTVIWHIQTLVLGVLVGFLGLIAILPRDVVFASIFGSIAGLFLLALVVNVLRGPSCSFHLRTAVQVEYFPSISRLRIARRVMARLRPLIAQAQGQLAPQDIPLLLHGLLNSPGKPAVGYSPQQYIVDDPNAPPRVIP